VYREAVIKFIKRKDEALCRMYIPGRTAEELWPYTEEESQEVVERLKKGHDDVEICPWCILHFHKGCEGCVYKSIYGDCTVDESHYHYVRERVAGGDAIHTFLVEEKLLSWIKEVLYDKPKEA